MKYRVLKVGEENYIPQYKSWWSFGWRNFTDNLSGGGRSTVAFFTETCAIDYCQSQIKVKEPEKVVWESNPDRIIATEPE